MLEADDLKLLREVMGLDDSQVHSLEENGVDVKAYLDSYKQNTYAKHASVRIYANHDYVTNIVAAEDLLYHIWYNLTFRPGTFLFIDGKLTVNSPIVSNSNGEYQEVYNNVPKIDLRGAITRPYR